MIIIILFHKRKYKKNVIIFQKKKVFLSLIYMIMYIAFKTTFVNGIQTCQMKIYLSFCTIAINDSSSDISKRDIIFQLQNITKLVQEEHPIACYMYKLHKNGQCNEIVNMLYTQSNSLILLIF